MNDFTVCPHGGCGDRALNAAVALGELSQANAVLARLDELMRRVREDGYQLQYQDLVELRGAA